MYEQSTPLQCIHDTLHERYVCTVCDFIMLAFCFYRTNRMTVFLKRWKVYTPIVQQDNRRTLRFQMIQRANSIVTRVRLHSFQNSTNAGFVSPMSDRSVAHGVIPFLWDQHWSTSAQLHMWVTILIPWHTLCLNVWSLANQQISMSFGYLLYTYKCVTQNMAYISSIAGMDMVSCTVLWSVTYSRKCLWKNIHKFCK